MTLPATGPLSLGQIQTEFGAPARLGSKYGVASGVPASGAIKVSDFRGKSAASAITWRALNHMDSVSGNSTDAATGTLSWYNLDLVSMMGTPKFGVNSAFYSQTNSVLPNAWLQSPFTMECWAQISDFTAFLYIQSNSGALCTGFTGVRKGLYEGVLDVGTGVSVPNGDYGTTVANVSYNVTGYNHFAFSWDGSVFRWFVNGYLIRSATASMSSVTNSQIVLWNYIEDPDTGYYEYKGIDELAFFSGARVSNFTPWTRAYTTSDNPLGPQT